MLDFINRVRKFDPRKLTPVQIIVGVAAALVGIWVVWQIIQALLTLVPIAAGIVIIYMAYRWLNSRVEDLPQEATKSQNQKIVDEALANVKAAASGVFSAPKSENAVVVEEADTLNLEAEVAAAPSTHESKLVIEQVVNPETGFKEPDISRLIEREEQKLKEADRVNEEVLSQIEERRRRLRGKQGGE